MSRRVIWSTTKPQKRHAIIICIRNQVDQQIAIYSHRLDQLIYKLFWAINSKDMRIKSLQQIINWSLIICCSQLSLFICTSKSLLKSSLEKRKVTCPTSISACQFSWKESYGFQLKFYTNFAIASTLWVMVYWLITVTIPMVPFLAVSFPPTQLLRSTCQWHLYACSTWQVQPTACKRLLANLDKHTVLALHLKGQYLVDQKRDSTDYAVHKPLGRPWFLL